MKPDKILSTVAGIGVLAASVCGQWAKVTDFEGMVADEMNRYFQYPGFGTFYVTPGLDPEDFENTALYMDAEERGIRCNRLHVAVPLPEPVAVGSVATLRFEFYQYGTSYDLNIGLSPTEIVLDEESGLMAFPNSFADFEAQMRMNSPIDARDGNNFRPTVIVPPVNEWVTFYLVVDNGAQTVEGYMKRADGTMEKFLIPMPDGQPAKDNWLYRVGGGKPLLSFYVGSSNSCERGYDLGDIWLIDNIYLDVNGRNLDDGTLVESPFVTLMGGAVSVGENLYTHPLFGQFTPFPAQALIYSHRAGAWMSIAGHGEGSFTAYHHGLGGWAYLPASAVGFAYVYGGGWHYVDDGSLQPLP